MFTTIDCPKCSGPIVREFEVSATMPQKVRFKAKCPHCGSTVEIEIRTELVSSVYANGIKIKDKEPKIRQL